MHGGDKDPEPIYSGEVIKQLDAAAQEALDSLRLRLNETPHPEAVASTPDIKIV